MKLTTVIYALIFILLLSSCSVKKLYNDAILSYQHKEYYNASEKFREVNKKLKDKSLKPEVYYKLAETYRNMGDYTKASVWYKNSSRLKYKVKDLDLRYADALRACGKLDEAGELYQAILDKKKNDEWAENGIEAIRRIEEWESIPPLYVVDSEKSLSSLAHDVVNSLVVGNPDKIYLSSAREESLGKSVNPATGQKFSDLYYSVFDTIKGIWERPVPLNIMPINSEQEETWISFADSGRVAVFSRETNNSDKEDISRLFIAYNKGGAWTNPELLRFSADGYQYKQPMLEESGKTLYFSSNRPNGIGGFDIWKVSLKEDGSFSEPENMGQPINTMGNEISPFQKPNKDVYFASDFHPGLGGYDIFRARKATAGKWAVEQMPPSVNSSADDWGIIFFGDRERGFLTSNRKSSRGNDIYSFFLPPKLFQCFGKVYDNETDSLLKDVSVRLVGSDGTSQKVRSVNGTFRFSLNPESEYAVVVFAKGYLNAQAKISTTGLKEGKEFNVDIKHIPVDKSIRIENINYEFGKWEILPKSMPSLKKLIEILKLNPGAYIKIMSHTDDVGDDDFNLELSMKRANSVVNYLVSNGISKTRLESEGFGETMPYQVSPKIARRYSFLKGGTVLTKEFIDSLPNENQKEIARKLNRRTEFRVIKNEASNEN